MEEQEEDLGIIRERFQNNAIEIVQERNLELDKEEKPIRINICESSHEAQLAASIVCLAFKHYELYEFMCDPVDDPRKREEYSEELRRFCSTFGVMDAYMNGVVLCAREVDTDKLVGVLTLSVSECPPIRTNLVSKAFASINEFLGNAFFALWHCGIPPFLYTWYYGTKVNSRFDCFEDMNAVRFRNMRQDEHPHLHLMFVAIHPEFQSGGIGKVLLDTAILIGKESNMNLWLETDTERHEKFYSKFGFVTREKYTLVSKDDGETFDPNFGMKCETRQRENKEFEAKKLR